MSIRGFAYDHGLLKAFAVECPVISIGNLTAGGTGKTPMTALLCKGILAKGLSSGVISRGYGGATRGPERVASDGSSASASHFGDEPTWIAASFPEVSVYVGRDKVAAARAMIHGSKHRLHVILADDAFQHRRLKRDLDVVILDASEPEWHERSLPLGRLREGFRSLKRAHFVFINKTNLADPERLLRLKAKVAAVQVGSKFQVLEFESVISGFVPLRDFLKDDVTISSQDFRSRKVILVSGIGRPETFKELTKLSGVDILEHVIFPDHHPYSADDFTKLASKAKASGASAIFTTEKDAIKMSNWNPPLECFVSRFEVRSKGTMEGFYEAVHRLRI